MRKMNKRGSVTVLAAMLLVTMITVIMTFVHASKMLAVKGVAAEAGLLWCESVLGEYDLNLRNRYGLFGFYGVESDISEKIDDYAQRSFADKRYIRYEGSSCELYEYSLASVRNFREQAVKTGKLVAAGVVKKPDCGIRAAVSADVPVDGEAVLQELPSAGMREGMRLPSLKQLGRGEKENPVKKGSDRYFEDRYIQTFFRDFLDEETSPVYFRGEVEYVLAGKKSDKENQRTVKRALMTMRTALNLAYILKEPEMKAKTAAAAALLAPEAQPAMQKAVETAWAAAEAWNDCQLLQHGKKVPWMKDRKSWATDLESVIRSFSAEKGKSSLKKRTPYVDPGNVDGPDYGGYLAVLLYAMNREVKIMRAMDLIQINMRRCYYGSFRIRDYSCGLDAELKINGSRVHVRKMY